MFSTTGITPYSSGIFSQGPEVVEGAVAVADGAGGADGLGYVLLGSLSGCVGGVAQDEAAQEGAGEGAAGPVGGGGDDVFAGEPVDLACGDEEEVVRRIEVAGGGEDVEIGVGSLELVSSFGEVFAAGDGMAGEEAEFFQVGGDPVDQREEAVAELSEAFGVEQFPA